MGMIKGNAFLDLGLIKERLPVLNEFKKQIEKNRKEISDIINGKSNKKLLIVGPCSIDFEDSVFEYAKKIKQISDKVNDKIKIVMRVYSGKPRTINGWKGMIKSGEFGDEKGINYGIKLVRKLMLKIIKLGLPIGDELLYTYTIPFFDDLISYGVLGARNTESQQHREILSGMNFPVGIKNPTNGNLNLALNTLESVKKSNKLIYNNYEYQTDGNQNVNIILRGGNVDGKSFLNFDKKNILKLKDLTSKRGLNNNFIIDLNHDNSGKNGLNQINNLDNILSRKIKNLIGIMVESYIFDGNQSEKIDIKDIVKGKSVTDSCLGIDKTEELIMRYYRSL